MVYERERDIFADKSSLILRQMIAIPQKRWVIRDFVRPNMLSLGLAQGILATMEKLGYAERQKRGPESFTTLTNQELLLVAWLKKYQFSSNIIHTYYSPDKGILQRIRDYFKGKGYALTLHTGANLITSYVNTDEIYCYLAADFTEKEILDLRQKLDLKELKSGGNVHMVRPYYRHSVFFNARTIKGYRVVSNLQLYLDLYNFQPRGREHAEYLKNLLEEKGKCLD